MAGGPRSCYPIHCPTVTCQGVPWGSQAFRQWYPIHWHGYRHLSNVLILCSQSILYRYCMISKQWIVPIPPSFQYLYNTWHCPEQFGQGDPFVYFCPLDFWKLRKCADSFFFITSPYFAWRLNFAQFCLILQLSAEVGENLFPLMFAFSIFMGGSHYFQKLN